MWLNKVAHFLGRTISLISRIINGVGLGILAAMMLLISMDVMGRYFFNRPITGCYELTELMMAVLVAFGLAYTGVHKGHISLDLVISRFSPRTQAAINTITVFFSLGIFSLITWRTFLYAENLRLAGDTSKALLIPLYPFVYVVAFGSAILCLVFIYNFFEHLTQVVEGARWWVWSGPLLIIVLILGLFASPLQVSPITVGLFGICLLIVLLFSGIPVGIATALAGFVGMTYVVDVSQALRIMGTTPFSIVSSYSLSVIPLLVFMTALVQQSGIAQSIYASATGWLGPLPGRLALGSVAACTLNSAAIVSSQANAATVGAVALPQMRSYNYDPAVATGCIAAGGTLGILIPPSLGLILYAILTEQSIGKLFLAGLIPGVIMSALFMVYVLMVGCFRPHLTPRAQLPSGKQLVIGLVNMLLPLMLGIIILCGLFLGIMTPVEAAGVAAFIAFILALIRTLAWRRPVLSVLRKAVHQTVKTTCMIMLILIGIMIFGYFLAVTRLPFELAEFVSGLPVNRYIILVFMFLVYIFLGCFIEPVTLMMVSMPIFFPVSVLLGFDPIWFGVILMLLIAIGMVLPPAGRNLRVVQSLNRGHPMKEIIIGVAPFVALMAVMLGLLVVFPQLALFLPVTLMQ